MGSAHFFGVCPRCGFIMNVGNWYHSNSYIYDCFVCGWHASKMIYYECSPCYDENTDIDGYYRSYGGGHGAVRTDKTFGSWAILPKRTADEKIKIAEGRTVFYETWCEDDKPIKIKFYNDCSELEDFKYLVFKRKNGKIYVSALDNIAVDMLPHEVVSSFDTDKRYIEAAYMYEPVLYGCDVETFLQQVANKVHDPDHALSSCKHWNGFDDDKAKYCTEYKERTGRDFDFEKRYATPFKWREHMFFAEHKGIDRIADVETEIDADFEEIRKYIGRYIDHIDDEHTIIVGYDNTVDKVLDRKWDLLCRAMAKMLRDKIPVLTNDAALFVVKNTLLADCKFYESVTQLLVSDETHIRELYCQEPFIKWMSTGVPYVPDMSWHFDRMLSHGCGSDFGRALCNHIERLKAGSYDESYIADCDKYLAKLKKGK